MPRARLAFHFPRGLAARAQAFRPGDEVPDDVALFVHPSLLVDDGEDGPPDADDDTVADAPDPDDLTDLDNLVGGDDDDDDDAPDQFDPNDHGIKGVLDHLEASSEDEYARVFALEQNGQRRKGIIGA